MGQEWGIIYYKSSAQSVSPIYDFINQLNPRAKAKIINTLNLLEKYGLNFGPPHVKKLTGTDLWELRLLGQDNIRIFYVTVTGKAFLLLHGFIKKKQKTDLREIKVALERLKEYKLRLS